MVSSIERSHCIQDSQLGTTVLVRSASSASVRMYVLVYPLHMYVACVHHCSVSVIQLMCHLPSQVTEGVQAGPSVGEMSERSRKLEEEIEAMTSQLNATAAS